MFDGRFRAPIERAVKPVGMLLRRTGMSPDHLTILGIVVAVGAAFAIGQGALRGGLVLVIAAALPDMLDGVTPLRLQRAYLRVTQPKPPTSIDLFHVAPIRASVAEALMEMLETLPKLGKVTFRQITEAIYDRIEVVVRFLAILELYKQVVLWV